MLLYHKTVRRKRGGVPRGTIYFWLGAPVLRLCRFTPRRLFCRFLLRTPLAISRCAGPCRFTLCRLLCCFPLCRPFCRFLPHALLLFSCCSGSAVLRRAGSFAVSCCASPFAVSRYAGSFAVSRCAGPCRFTLCRLLCRFLLCRPFYCFRIPPPVPPSAAVLSVFSGCPAFRLLHAARRPAPYLRPAPPLFILPRGACLTSAPPRRSYLPAVRLLPFCRRLF